MTPRTAALVCGLLVVVVLTLLTVTVFVRNGFDVLVLLSLVILALIGSGVAGALLNPPEE